MLRTEDTRRHSHQAHRQHGIAQATQHGWSHAGLPLTVTLSDMLRCKAAREDEVGDRADAVLMRAGLQ